MSTLTKILIVLLTVASIFLCGLVVTYVASADNFRQKYNRADQDLRAAQANEKNAQQQLRQKVEETDREKVALNQQIASLKIQVGDLETKLTDLERQKAVMAQEVDKFASVMEGFTKTNDQQGLLLKNTFARLENSEAELIKERSQHKETATTLLEKMTIIATLQERNKQLLEEKTELQTKMDQFLRQYGQVFAPPKPVTVVTAKARPAPPTTVDIGLKGQVTRVDLKNKMAEVSIGRAHGVKEEMKFHVIRGDQFICDILILDVQPEKAVGILDLFKAEQPPRAGDEISTNL